MNKTDGEFELIATVLAAIQAARMGRSRGKDALQKKTRKELS